MREIVITLFIILASCSKEGAVSWPSLRSRAQKGDPTFSIVLAEKIGGGPKCVGETPSLSYSKGCQKVIRVKVKDIDFLFVGFENAEQAKKEAQRLNQVYYHNWLIDEVRGEPPLEAFVKNTFGVSF